MLSPLLPSAKNPNHPLPPQKPTPPKPQHKSRQKLKIHAYANSITTNLLEIFTNEYMILCPW